MKHRIERKKDYFIDFCELLAEYNNIPKLDIISEMILRSRWEISTKSSHDLLFYKVSKEQRLKKGQYQK